MTTATLIAGAPMHNMTLLHRTHFPVGDPCALIELKPEGGGRETVFIVRDIEADRARAAMPHANVITPHQAHRDPDSLPGDRELTTALAIADYLDARGVTQVTADRSLALIYASALTARGIPMNLDPDLGLADRRQKSPNEIGLIHQTQQLTEQVIEMICGTIASATAQADGTLHHKGEPLTSESLAATARAFLIEKNHDPGPIIVACGPAAADCHYRGSGALYTEQPVIVDVFPTNLDTHYVGDCTRCVVHGQVPEEVAKLHGAVKRAKAAAIGAVSAGVSAHDVHGATVASLNTDGFDYAPPNPDAPGTATMPHGTGHGVGLEVHELPLVDVHGPELIDGDAITIEPGLYQPNLGGIRIEDIVIVTADDHMNLNSLHEELDWTT